MRAPVPLGLLHLLIPVCCALFLRLAYIFFFFVGRLPIYLYRSFRGRLSLENSFAGLITPERRWGDSPGLQREGGGGFPGPNGGGSAYLAGEAEARGESAEIKN